MAGPRSRLSGLFFMGSTWFNPSEVPCQPMTDCERFSWVRWAGARHSSNGSKLPPWSSSRFICGRRLSKTCHKSKRISISKWTNDGAYLAKTFLTGCRNSRRSSKALAAVKVAKLRLRGKDYKLRAVAGNIAVCEAVPGHR